MIEQNACKFRIHLFVCTSCIYEDCGREVPMAAAQQLRKNLKEMIKDRYPTDPIRINASGCLGQCDHGITCVIYPYNIWLKDLRPNDEEKVVSLIDNLMKESPESP